MSAKPVPWPLFMQSAYPIAIYQDRYGGTYSKGKWVAVGNSDRDVNDIHDTDAFGGDMECMSWWDEHSADTWLAVGNTPDEALDRLRQRWEA